jgi:nucleotide-binding universal stress UspA family protein
MRNILVAVDGSDNARRAVAWVADSCRSHGPVEIHLVNAEPRPLEWQTRGLAREPIEEHLRWRSAQAIEACSSPLREAGLAYESIHVLGDAAESIADTATRLGCDVIVMGRRGLGAIRGMVLGSVSLRLLHLTGLPVVLVK